jgi:hypothetical protein
MKKIFVVENKPFTLSSNICPEAEFLDVGLGTIVLKVFLFALHRQSPLLTDFRVWLQKPAV